MDALVRQIAYTDRSLTVNGTPCASLTCMAPLHTLTLIAPSQRSFPSLASIPRVITPSVCGEPDDAVRRALQAAPPVG